MAEIQKPDSLNSIWAIAGDKTKPDESKIQEGWGVEIPMVQYENWLTNRQDQAIAHVNQRGIGQWDRKTPYIANKSYVQGSDGKVYKARVDNEGVDPTQGGDTWMVAFVATDEPDSLRVFNGYVVISQSFTPALNTRYYAINSLTLTLPQTAALGDNVIVNKAGGLEVTINVMGSKEISTKRGKFEEIVYDIDDEINVVWNGSNWQTA